MKQAFEFPEPVLPPKEGWKLGSELCKDDQERVLDAFVMRRTGDNDSCDKTYPTQFVSDQEWLENTYFKIGENGRYDQRYGQCESHPTWPFNPELRK